MGDRTYKNHLDSYNQLDMIPGKGPSTRHEIFYFTQSNLAAVSSAVRRSVTFTLRQGWWA